MKRRDVVAALEANGCTVLRDKGNHTIYVCACPRRHTAPVPRHREITPGVVRSISRYMECLPEGWLQ